MTPTRRKSMPGAGIEPALRKAEKGFKGAASAPAAGNAPKSDDLSPAPATVFATGLAKHCPRCGETKPLAEFNTRLKRGVRIPQPYCKPCFLAYWHEWYDRGGKKTFGEAVKRYHERYPERHAARIAAYAAFEAGRIVRGPCAMRADGRCDGGQIQMHHPDYSKPLEVVWLCRLHHREADKTAGIGKRGRPRKAVA